MSTTDPERDEDQLLLPWHVTGRLRAAEAARIESALACEPELARRLDLARAERDGTEAVNEGLGAPSMKARDDLFARIDADLAARERGPRGWLRRMGEALAGLSPPMLAGSALAACLLLLLQAGLLTGAWLGGSPTTYETASHDASGPSASGTFLLVTFGPTATAAQITEALAETGLSIVDGPRAGGIYRLRLSDGTEGRGSPSAVVDRLRTKPGLVVLAVPEPVPAR
ncbi:anti-sigma factor RsiW [Methylorubrum extorquens]